MGTRRGWLLIGPVLLIGALWAAGCTPAPTSPTGPPGSVQTPAGKTYNWKFQAAYNLNDYFMQVSVGSFKEYVEKRTGGRLTIELLPPGALAPVPEQLAATGSGVIDAGWSYGPFYAGVLPVGNIEAGLPGIWPTAQEAHDAFYNRGLVDIIRPEYMKQNVFWAPSYMGDVYPIGLTKPASSLADLKGRKIRATGPYADLVSMFGAAPVVMAGGEVYTGLKLGTVEGWIMSATSLESYSFAEVTNTLFSSPSLGTVVGHWAINLDRWKELPADIQQVILDFFKDGSLRAAADNWARTQALLSKSSKDGKMTLRTWSDADWQRIQEAGPTIAEKLKQQGGPGVAQSVDIIAKQQRDYGRWR